MSEKSKEELEAENSELRALLRDLEFACDVESSETQCHFCGYRYPNHKLKCKLAKALSK